MTSRPRETFTTRIDAEILAELRALARAEGRPTGALVDEALADLLEKRRRARPRSRVLAAYEASRERFGSLYERLAD